MVDDDFHRRQDERIAQQIAAVQARRMWAAKEHKDNVRRRVYGNRQRHLEKIARLEKVTVTLPITARRVEGSRTKLTVLRPDGTIIWLTIPTEWIGGYICPDPDVHSELLDL